MENQTKPTAQLTNTFFVVSHGQYVMHSEDLKYDSDKAMRVRFFDIAENVNVCDRLKLLYCDFTKQPIGEAFATYVAQFGSDTNSEERRDYLMTNPVVGLLIEDAELHQFMKKELRLLYAAYISYVKSDKTYQEILDGNDMSVRIEQDCPFFDVGSERSRDKIFAIINRKADEKYGAGKWKFDYGIGLAKKGTRIYPKATDVIL